MKKSGIKGRMIAVASVGLICLMALSVLTPTVSAGYAAAWSFESPLGGVRAQAVVLQATNGTVYIIGGEEGVFSTAVNTVTSYNPSTGGWKTLATLLVAVRGATGGIVSNGTIYIFGGDSGITTTQIYHPLTNSWTTGADIPLVSWEGKCVNDETHMYVFGGSYTHNVQIYNITTNSWWPGQDMPTGILAGAAVKVGGSAYYFGGENTTAQASNDVYRYDIAGDSWTRVKVMPRAVCAQGAITGPDGLIYIFGGSNRALNIPPTTYGFGFYYDVAADEYGMINDLNVPRAWLGVAVLDSKVLAIGGNNAATFFTSVESLDTSGSVASLQKHIDQLQSQIDQANVVISNLTGQVSVLKDKDALLKQQLVDLSAQLNQTKADLDAANAALGTTNNNVNNAKSAADSANMIGMIGIIIGIVAILIAVIALVIKKKASIQQMQPMPPMPPQ